MSVIGENLDALTHSTCKTVLNLLEAVYLRLRKTVVERVTVVKIRVDNRGSDGTGCLESRLTRHAVVACSAKRHERVLTYTDHTAYRQ